MNFDNLEHNLDIEPVSEKIIQIKEFKKDLKKIKDFASQKEFDFIDTRERLLALIEVSETAIERLLEISIESEESRAFEVLAKLIETVKQCNETLIDLHEKYGRQRNIKDIEEKTEKQGYLTAEEIQKKILGKK